MNTPKSSRSSAGLRSTSLKPLPVCLPGAACAVGAGASGTHHSTTAMPPSASAPVSAKMPCSPTAAASSGASTSDSANISAMLPPTSAIALVRTSSRVESASSAVTAAEIAPAP